MNDIVEASQSSTRELQEQIDIYKEKNRRELAELQKLLKERGQELEKYLLGTKTLQDEVNTMVIQRRDTVVRSRPLLVRQSEPSHIDWHITSYCSEKSYQHQSLLLKSDLGIFAPRCLFKPKA